MFARELNVLHRGFLITKKVILIWQTCALSNVLRDKTTVRVNVPLTIRTVFSNAICVVLIALRHVRALKTAQVGVMVATLQFASARIRQLAPTFFDARNPDLTTVNLFKMTIINRT